MSPVSTVVTAAFVALVLALPAQASAQRYVSTSTIFNGNICHSQGSNCHVPRPLNGPPAISRPMIITQPPQAATVSLGSQPGLLSRLYSGFTSLF